MPRADDMRLIVIVGLGHKRAVLGIEVDHLAPDDTLAGRAALVQAMVAVGVIGAVMPIDADLDPALTDNADIAILHLDVLAYENLRHPSRSPSIDRGVKRVLQSPIA